MNQIKTSVQPSIPQLAAGMGRLGTETAFDVLAKAKMMEEAGRNIINLGIGQPDFATPPNIVEAAVKALRDGHHGYTPANGTLALRQAVAEDIAKHRGVEVDPGNVLVVPGGKVTMFFAVLIFGEPGAEILYPNPRLPDLRIGDQLHRGDGGSDSALRVQRLLVQRRGGAGQDHVEDPTDHPQQPRPTRPAARCRARSSTGWSRAWRITRRSS